jgi:hypothetical protein
MDGLIREIGWIPIHGGDLVSILVVDIGEASRGLRNHVKEPEPKTNAEPQLALAA